MRKVGWRTARIRGLNVAVAPTVVKQQRVSRSGSGEAIAESTGSGEGGGAGGVVKRTFGARAELTVMVFGAAVG